MIVSGAYRSTGSGQHGGARGKTGGHANELERLAARQAGHAISMGEWAANDVTVDDAH